MNKAFAFLKKEFLEMLPPTIFFFIVLHIALMVRTLMAQESSVSVASSATATILALVAGKAILIADATPISHWFSRNRLVYNVVWRVFIYGLVILLFQLLEELVPLLSKANGVLAAWKQLLNEVEWYRFWAIHVILVTFLTIYCIASTVVGAVGRAEVLSIFFGASDSR